MAGVIFAPMQGASSYVPIIGSPGLSSYADEVMADNPYGYWPMNECAGSRMMDLTGRNHSIGTSAVGRVGGDLLVGGTYGGWSWPGGAYNGVQLGAFTAFLASAQTSGFTIEAWVKGVTSQTTQVVFDTYGASPRIGLYIVTSGTQFQCAMAGNGGTFRSITPLFKFGSGRRHLVFTANPSTGDMAVYVDGALISKTNVGTSGQGTWTGAAQPNAGWSSNTGGASAFPGVMAHGALYGKMLTADRVLAHYRKGIEAFDYCKIGSTAYFDSVGFGATAAIADDSTAATSASTLFAGTLAALQLGQAASAGATSFTSTLAQAVAAAAATNATASYAVIGGMTESGSAASSGGLALPATAGLSQGANASAFGSPGTFTTVGGFALSATAAFNASLGLDATLRQLVSANAGALGNLSLAIVQSLQATGSAVVAGDVAFGAAGSLATQGGASSLGIVAPLAVVLSLEAAAQAAAMMDLELVIAPDVFFIESDQGVPVPLLLIRSGTYLSVRRFL